MMTDDGEIYELYDRFRREVKKRVRDMYYDEDELAVIFDIAADEHDAYTQTEVLMLGRRLWPDSDMLAVRQGFMIDPYEDKVMAEFLENHKNNKGVLWDILRIKAPGLTDAEAEQAMADMLRTVTFEEDEEIIRFVELIEHYQAYDWFREHYKEFMDRCSYRDTALNECARIFESEDTDLSIELLEELSRIDPFGADTWMKLAELYRHVGRLDDAFTAIDYAKAIRPDDTEILYTEATIYMEKDITDPRVTEILQRVVRERPSWLIAKRDLARAYVAQGKDDLAELVLEEDRDVLSYETSQGNTNGTAPDSEEFFFESPDMERLMNSNHAEALRMLRDYDARHGVSRKAYMLVHLLYEAGDMEGLTEFMERERPEGARELMLDPVSLAMYAAALLRTGRTEEAAEVSREYLVKMSRAASTLESKLAIAGVKIALNYILASAEQGKWSADSDPLLEAMS